MYNPDGDSALLVVDIISKYISFKGFDGASSSDLLFMPILLKPLQQL